MPDYFAHLTFGEKVFFALPEGLQNRIKPQIEAYINGQYGPDPLFFLNSRTRKLAQRMHHSPAKLPLANLSGAVAKGEPCADGFAAGFLCHFVLDSVCHRYVTDIIGRTNMNHTMVEAEFDRFLMARRGILALKRMPMPPMSRDYNVYAAGAAPFGISPATYNHSLIAFRLVSDAITLANGTRARSIVQLVGKTVPGLSALQGSVAAPIPNFEAYESNRALSVLLESAVEQCRDLIVDFFNQADHGGIFYTPQLEQDFYGNVVGKNMAVSNK